MKIFVALLITQFLFPQNIDSLILRAKEEQNRFNDMDAYKLYEKVLSYDSMQLNANIESSVLLCQIGHKDKDEDTKLSFFNQAISFAERAARIDSTSDKAHLSLARSYGRLAQISSAKEKLKLSVKVKKHAELTVKYNPNEDIAYHILGKWHYTIADLSWLEKAVANTVLGGVPEGASFLNAKKAFEKAISIKRNSISHHLELARTLIVLDQEDEAKGILKKTLELEPEVSIDTEYLEEAKELLADLE
jgi:regulator of microtubule dynamics protein 3